MAGDSSQKELQKGWYNRGNARCSLDLSGLNNQRHYERLNALINGFPIHGPVLEVGCGNGWYSGKFGRAFGVDISMESLKKRHDQSAVAIAADAERLPFNDNSFSFVYGFAILHHLESIERGLAEIHRVLKPGGRIAFGSENSALCPMNYLFPFLYGNWHVEKGFTRVSPRRMADMAEGAGFKEFRHAMGGFAVYGMTEGVYRFTRRIEDGLSRSPAINRFSGFLYFTAVKP